MNKAFFSNRSRLINWKTQVIGVGVKDPFTNKAFETPGQTANRFAGVVTVSFSV